jgi:hypothetical protein
VHAQHRTSFGSAKVDADLIQWPGCDAWSLIKIHSQGGKEKMKPFLPFFHDTL